MKSFIKSIGYAVNGIVLLIKGERNAKIHVAAAILVSIFGLVFKISNTEWIMVCICIFSVIAAEAFNTAIEGICNFIEPQMDDRIKKIKDVSAAAVLLISIMSIIVAGLIFIPKILLQTN